MMEMAPALSEELQVPTEAEWAETVVAVVPDRVVAAAVPVILAAAAEMVPLTQALPEPLVVADQVYCVICRNSKKS